MRDKLKECHSQLVAAILDLNAPEAEQLARQILADGGDPQAAIQEVIKPTADEIGEKFQREEFFLPQLMVAGQALEAAMNVFAEAVPAAEHESKRVVVIGTVKGDVHTIGKNVVAMMLRTGGFDIHDLRVDVDADTFVRQAIDRDADIIALSSLLTTTLPYQRDVIDALTERRLRERFKVIVGGGPVTQLWADEIGADGFGKDAAEAVTVAQRLVGA